MVGPINTCPYFFILPVYAMAIAVLAVIALALVCFKRHRRKGLMMLAGTFGTFPGFVVGNLLFWLVLVGIATVLKTPLEKLSSDLVNGVVGVGLAIFVVVGLALANIVGCLAGFFGTIWIIAKLFPKKTTPSELQ